MELGQKLSWARKAAMVGFPVASYGPSCHGELAKLTRPGMNSFLLSRTYLQLGSLNPHLSLRRQLDMLVIGEGHSH